MKGFHPATHGACESFRKAAGDTGKLTDRCKRCKRMRRYHPYAIVTFTAREKKGR